MAASDNPALQEPLELDPTLFATAYKSKRFYLLTRREPADTLYAAPRCLDDDAAGHRLTIHLPRHPRSLSLVSETAGQSGRDVFNEKPTREELAIITNPSEKHALGSMAVLHTNMGDITVRLPHVCIGCVQLRYANRDVDFYYARGWTD